MRNILSPCSRFEQPSLQLLYYANKSLAATGSGAYTISKCFSTNVALATASDVVVQTKRERQAIRAADQGSIAMDLLESHGWIAWIIIGGLAGAIAKLLMPGKDPGGCIITVLLGIAGALLAGFLGQMLDIDSAMNGAGFIGAILGAFLILLIYRLVLKRR
jgi:uncharacterized membrane protein YeaQ/YmgE (transglycosylase-associated protein family)